MQEGDEIAFELFDEGRHYVSRGKHSVQVAAAIVVSIVLRL